VAEIEGVAAENQKVQAQGITLSDSSTTDGQYSDSILSNDCLGASLQGNGSNSVGELPCTSELTDDLVSGAKQQQNVAGQLTHSVNRCIQEQYIFEDDQNATESCQQMSFLFLLVCSWV